LIYVVDSNSFRILESYYPDTFPSFWENISDLVADGRFISVDEVYKEIQNGAAAQHILDWADHNREIFGTPSEIEMGYVGEIFAVPHFRQLIGQRQLLKGSPVADPWLVACARHVQGCVVTEEFLRPNAARIPNVCQHFGVDVTDVKGMLEREGWRF
jgi:hypothetical protein